jgi:NTP pyrophosphatase (non-canonical NTP hydrolase)
MQNEYSIQAMQSALLAFRRARDWEQFHNPKDQALSLALEVAELLELMQWRNGQELDRHLEERGEDLADELADILGWCLLIAADRGVCLGDAFYRKLAKNEKKYPAELVRGSAKKYREYRETPDTSGPGPG